MLLRVASFHTHGEAQVAASALRAASVRAEVFDHYYLTANWLLIEGLGGIRVMAPDEQFALARQILANIQTTTAPDLAPEDKLPVRQDSGWRIGAGLLCLTPMIGWAVLAIGRTRRISEKCLAAGVAAVAVAVVFIATSVIGHVLRELTSY